ncbi:MAG: metallophosphoesterase [Gemmatimonadales bacterium]|nr:metallophosphoesterase [Gemmatimonadales bacterium]
MRSVLLCLILLVPTLGSAQAPERIVAVGDVHGDFGQFTTILRQAAVIDDGNRWIGGRTILVQTGDVLDRGPDSRKVMELLMALESEAKRAGGRVHALIGNHEAMNVLGDLRYVSAGEYESFRSPNAVALRDRAYSRLSDSTRRDDPEYRRLWETEHPLGWVEHRLAFEGNGRYGTWIRRHDAVLKVGDYLFLHGGIGPKYADRSAADLNREIREALTRPGVETTIADDPDGPLWYRGLATGVEAELAAHVDQVLNRFGVKHIVIGHTPTPGAILPRFEGRVILIDVGLSAAYGGPPAALVIENGVPFALHRGSRLALPLDGDVVPYLRAAAALDPQPSRLKQFIDRLEGVTPVPPR